MRIAALLPMRHESERVPGKNYRDFHGRPLFMHAVEALRRSGRITEIVIDTDSPTIKELVAGEPEVRAIDRPEHLLGGHVPMNDVLLHDVTVVDADLYLQTHSTNPMLRPETIARAIDALVASEGAHDSLFSVTPLRTRLWTPEGKPLNHDPSVLMRTQDLPPVYEENSLIYIFTREGLERDGNRIGRTPMMFEIDASEAVDIDEEVDWSIAVALYEHQKAAS